MDFFTKPPESGQNAKVLQGQRSWGFLKVSETWAVAGHTLMCSRLVVQDGAVLDIADELMTVPTRNGLVSTFERKVRPTLVIKQGGLPARCNVAVGTSGIHAVPGKLTGMGIFVAALTLPGSGTVNDVLHCDFQVWRFMATHASYGPVGACEEERSRRMIEAKFLRPGSGGMAGFTTQRRSIGAPYVHSLREFTPVRVHVASRT